MSSNKIFRIESEHLGDDNCLLSTLINVSDNVFIEKMLLVLERHDNIIHVELADIFLNNYIRIPTLEDHIQKQYDIIMCNDIKPLIKNLSWKDTRLLATEEKQINNILGDIVLSIEKNVWSNIYSYIDDDNRIVNLIKDTDWAIKLEGNSRGFGIYKGTVLFFNLDQFNRPEIKNESRKFISLIKEYVNDDKA